MFAKVPFELTTKEDRMRTCYMQACLAYVNFEGISNSDIRKIFGLGEKEKAKASRLLTSAVDGGYIKVMIRRLHQDIKSIFHIGHNLSFAKFHLYRWLRKI